MQNGVLEHPIEYYGFVFFEVREGLISTMADSWAPNLIACLLAWKYLETARFIYVSASFTVIFFFVSVKLLRK